MSRNKVAFGTSTRDGQEERDWARWARCRDLDPEVFFPNPTDKAGNARAVGECGRCEVWSQCRAWALSHPLDCEPGVWGGLTEAERRRIRRFAANERIARARDERQRS